MHGVRNVIYHKDIVPHDVPQVYHGLFCFFSPELTVLLHVPHQLIPARLLVPSEL